MTYHSRFTIIGISQEHDECENCGRTGLKRTVVLKTDEGGVVYYGTECAATVTRLGSYSDVERAAVRAQGVRDDLRRQRAEYADALDVIEAAIESAPSVGAAWPTFLTLNRHDAALVSRVLNLTKHLPLTERMTYARDWYENVIREIDADFPA